MKASRILAVLGVLAACGGKVVVDRNGSGDVGGAGGATSSTGSGLAGAGGGQVSDEVGG